MATTRRFIIVRCLSIALWAPVFGLASGFGGVALRHHCEYAYGAEQGSRRAWLEKLTLPALPGMVLAQHGEPDWQLDEAWEHRWAISGWNALAWGVVGLLVAPLIGVFMASRRGWRKMPVS